LENDMTKSDAAGGNVVALGRGDFFAVDRRAWAMAFDKGGVNAALAYLVMARGAGGDNRTTSWSAKAVDYRTNLSWRQAKEGIGKLVDLGLIRQDKGGKHPHYYLLPPHDVPGCEGYVPAAMSPEETALYERMLKTKSKDNTLSVSSADYQTAANLVCKGRAIQKWEGQRWFIAIRNTAETERPPAWIWLPNALVDGANGETPPIEICRQSGRPAALRLLVDLYDSQSLADFGGVHWRQLRQTFGRQKIGERGPCVVWGFAKGGQETWTNAPFVQPHLTGKEEKVDLGGGKTKMRDPGVEVFWDALAVLTQTGLVTFVEHVIDKDDDSGAVLHPYADLTGEPDERAIGAAAHAAGAAMLTPGQLEWVENQSRMLLLPALRHLGEIQIVGLARLRYHARTTGTSIWLARQEKWLECAAKYEAMRDGELSAEKANKERPMLISR
jgi:hypothetical protein